MLCQKKKLKFTFIRRIQKAREGKWNKGFAPYGYQLVDDKRYK